MAESIKKSMVNKVNELSLSSLSHSHGKPKESMVTKGNDKSNSSLGNYSSSPTRIGLGPKAKTPLGSSPMGFT